MAAHILFRPLSGSVPRTVGPFLVTQAGRLIIGRGPGASVLFDSAVEPAVSRRHAAIRIEAGPPPQFFITDLGSRNGTLVNGQPVGRETPVRPGDRIQLGTSGPSFDFALHPAFGPAEAARRQTPATGSSAGYQWPDYIDDLEAFALNIAADEVAWTQLLRSGAIAATPRRARGGLSGWLVGLVLGLLLAGCGAVALHLLAR